jgi:hypothetical protein
MCFFLLLILLEFLPPTPLPLLSFPGDGEDFGFEELAAASFGRSRRRARTRTSSRCRSR